MTKLMMMKRFSAVAFGSLVLFAAGCAETKNTNPVARIVLEGSPRINAPVVFDASGSADAEGAIKSYRFDFGDGTDTVSGVSRAEHTFTAAGSYTVTVTVTDEGGLRGSNRVEVTIADNQAPVASLSGPVLAVVGQQVSFDSSASVDDDGRITKFEIDFGDGSAKGVKPIENHIYNVAGVYDVVLTITDNEEATATVTRSIQVRTGAQSAATAPLARLSVAATANARESLTFDASLSQTPGATAEYKTYYGDGGVADGRSTNHAYQIAGNYTAVLMVTATYPDGSTAVSMDARQITVKALNNVHAAPKADFVIPASVRFGSTVVFDGSGTTAPGATAVAYDWVYGDAAVGTGSLTTHDYNTPGLFITRLTVTATYADATTAEVTQSKVLLVTPNTFPVASLSGPAEGLTSDSILFSADGSTDNDGAVIAYDWNFGDTNTGVGSSVAHAYQNPGVYEVTLTVTDNDNDVHTVSKLVTIRSYKAVAQLPQANLNGPVGLTVGQVGAFTVAGSTAPLGTSSFIIDFGDGTTSTAPAATHAYAAPGNYLATLLLTVTYPDLTTNTSVAYLPVEVISGSNANAAPVADFSAPAQVRFSQVVALDGGISTAPGATAITYTWNFGDSSPAAFGQAVTHTYAPGVHTISLTVGATYADGSVATAVRSRVITVNANVPPTAVLTGATQGLASDVLAFDASGSSDADGSIASIEIDFGDASPVVNSAAASHVFDAPGVYDVTLTVTDNDGATAITTRTVTISPYNIGAVPPVAILNGPTTLGVNQSGVFTSTGSIATGGVASYKFYFADGAVSTDPAAAHGYAAANDYLVKLLLIATYPDGTSNTSIAVLPVSVKVGSSSNPAPVAAFAAPSSIRYNETLVVDASASKAEGASSLAYAWNFGDTNTAAGQSASHSYGVTQGTFGVTLTVVATYPDNTTSFAQAIKFVGLRSNKAPTAAFTAPLVVTAGDVVGFDGSASKDEDGTIASYAFDFANGLSSVNPVATTTYATAGTYEVTLTVTDNEGASAVAVREVRVRSQAEAANAPVARLWADPEENINELVELDGSDSEAGSSPIVTYFWDLGDGRSFTGPSSLSVTYATRGAYTVQLAVTDATGLTSSTQRQVNIVNRAPWINWVDIDQPFSNCCYANSNIRLTAIGEAEDEDGDPISFQYQWFVNGLPVFGETATTFTGVKVAGDSVSLRVTPHDGFEAGQPRYSNTIRIDPIDDPENVRIDSSSPYRVADTITVTFNNPELKPYFEYEWYVNDTVVSTAEELTGAFVKGDVVYVGVRTVDGPYTGQWEYSGLETIVNTAPVFTSVNLNAGPHYEGSTITVSATASDADTDAITYTYVWLVDGIDIGNYSASITGSDFDKGQTVSVTVTANDGTDSNVASSATVTIQNTAPGTADVAIDEAVYTGNLFSKVLTDAVDIDGDSVTYEYAWLRNGVDQGFSTAQTDASNSSFLNGDRWTVVVTAIDDEFASGATAWATVSVSQFELLSGIAEKRDRSTATLLQDGRVLIVGGNAGGVTSTAELYDYSLKTFASTGTMAVAREYHSATLLPDGKVLIVGGATAELYDPVLGTFSGTTNPPGVARAYHTATLLANGKVLIVGDSAVAELYDPVADSFTATFGAPVEGRGWHTATLLADGTVLITGGLGSSSAEIYDPIGDAFTATDSLDSIRYWHTATKLPDNRVLIAGGRDATTELATAEVYDPVAGTFSPVADMAVPRALNTATLLDNGTVLMAGGWDNIGGSTDAEIFVPATNSWYTTRPLHVTVAEHTATLLPNGQVLINDRNTTELYVPFQ